jgi:hypothetical protein
MIKRTLCAIAVLLGIIECGGDAFADARDLPALICEKRDGSTGTIGYNGNDVSNDNATQSLVVECPIVLYAVAGRSLRIAGTDHHPTLDFSCTAYGWDVNLLPVTMPSIPITTGFFTDSPIGSINLPDSVVKLVIECTIPPLSGSSISRLSDFLIQN